MRRAVIFLTTALASLVPFSLEAVTPIGNTAVVMRDVEGQLEQNVRRLVVADRVFANEEVRTAPDSASELVFLDRTNLSVGPDTRLVLDRFVFDPDPSRASFAITATKGVFRFVSGTMNSNSYVVRTPTAIIGVRGTVFSCVVTAVSTICSTDTGSIRMSGGNRVLDVPADEWGMLPPIDERDARTYSNAALPPTFSAALRDMNDLLRLGRLAVLRPNDLNRVLGAPPASGGTILARTPITVPPPALSGARAAGSLASPSGF